MGKIIQFPSSCLHQFHTEGLLYTEHAGIWSPCGTLLEKFGNSGFFCHPQKELRMSDCAGVFSIVGTFAFYAVCSICAEKKEFYSHQNCFYCLTTLGEEETRNNLKDYFRKHAKTAKEVSLKTCPNCFRVFAWYRVDTDEEMGFK